MGKRSPESAVLPTIPKSQRGPGRPVTSPNKAKLTIEEKLIKIGCDPLIEMAKLAMDTNNTKELRGKMLLELAQYVYAKRRSIEHISVEPKLPRTELESRIGDLLKKMEPK